VFCIWGNNDDGMAWLFDAKALRARTKKTIARTKATTTPIQLCFQKAAQKPQQITKIQLYIIPVFILESNESVFEITVKAMAIAQMSIIP
jgi:hypothetical protein